MITGSSQARCHQGRRTRSKNRILTSDLHSEGGNYCQKKCVANPVETGRFSDDHAKITSKSFKGTFGNLDFPGRAHAPAPKAQVRRANHPPHHLSIANPSAT